MRHASADANGIRIHFVEEGRGPLVLLLHGFPEFWYAWRRQIPRISAAGFRVVAPDLRGYNETDRPSETGAYRIEQLVADATGLIAALGEEDAVLVGHDWGGVVAWYVAMLHPERVRRLVILNAPHPAAYARELRRGSSQIWRSWYAGFFQLPWIPEAAWRAADFALLRRVLRSGPARTPGEEAAYVEAFARPGAIRAAIDYYRAAIRYPRPPVRRITAPTALIWGERDPFLVPELAEGLERWVDDLRVERLPRATHWLHHEEPAGVADLIAGFAAERDGNGPGRRPSPA